MWPYSKASVPDCVEDAIYKLSNVHAQVDSKRLRRGSLTRSHDDTRRNFREDGTSFSDAVLVQ